MAKPPIQRSPTKAVYEDPLVKRAVGVHDAVTKYLPDVQGNDLKHVLNVIDAALTNTEHSINDAKLVKEPVGMAAESYGASNASRDAIIDATNKYIRVLANNRHDNKERVFKGRLKRIAEVAKGILNDTYNIIKKSPNYAEIRGKAPSLQRQEAYTPKKTDNTPQAIAGGPRKKTLYEKFVHKFRAFDAGLHRFRVIIIEEKTSMNDIHRRAVAEELYNLSKAVRSTHAALCPHAVYKNQFNEEDEGSEGHELETDSFPSMGKINKILSSQFRILSELNYIDDHLGDLPNDIQQKITRIMVTWHKALELEYEFLMGGQSFRDMVTRVEGTDDGLRNFEEASDAFKGEGFDREEEDVVTPGGAGTLPRNMARTNRLKKYATRMGEIADNPESDSEFLQHLNNFVHWADGVHSDSPEYKQILSTYKTILRYNGIKDTQ